MTLYPKSLVLFQQIRKFGFRVVPGYRIGFIGPFRQRQSRTQTVVIRLIIHRKLSYTYHNEHQTYRNISLSVSQVHKKHQCSLNSLRNVLIKDTGSCGPIRILGR